MTLLVAGLSHHTAPLDIRERLMVRVPETAHTLEQLRARSEYHEAVLLSTCNRTEIYAVEGESGEADTAGAVWTLLAERLGAPVAPYGYVRREREAVAHLFRVAAGMDSMILGEVQIHAQVRDAWEASRASSRAILNRLFQTAQLVASRIRNETMLGRGAASASSVAVQLAKKIFGTLQGRRAMILGAGEMAELALECLTAEGVRTGIVANRTHERAQELADRHGAVALHYDDCWDHLHEVDLLLTSTAAPHVVVEPHHVMPTLRARGDRPLCILDIAVPRDVDPAVGALDNVFLYDLDDLRSVAASNVERRRGELPSAEQVVAAETDKYWGWLAGLAAVPVLTSFRTRMDGVRADELAVALRKLEHLTPADRAAVEQFSRSLLNKFLHEPTVRLRAAAANGHGLAIVDAMRYLFALQDGTRERAADETRRDPAAPAAPEAEDAT